jgi:hypothetical protein
LGRETLTGNTMSGESLAFDESCAAYGKSLWRCRALRFLRSLPSTVLKLPSCRSNDVLDDKGNHGAFRLTKRGQTRVFRLDAVDGGLIPVGSRRRFRTAFRQRGAQCRFLAEGERSTTTASPDVSACCGAVSDAEESRNKLCAPQCVQTARSVLAGDCTRKVRQHTGHSSNAAVFLIEAHMVCSRSR